MSLPPDRTSSVIHFPPGHNIPSAASPRQMFCFACWCQKGTFNKPLGSAPSSLQTIPFNVLLVEKGNAEQVITMQCLLMEIFCEVVLVGSDPGHHWFIGISDKSTNYSMNHTQLLLSSPP